jgi:hypothetical protein
MTARKPKAKKIKQKNVALRPETHAKLQAVATTKRWKLCGAVDAILDDFIARERLKLPVAA